jgi:hypothetical protein
MTGPTAVRHIPDRVVLPSRSLPIQQSHNRRNGQKHAALETRDDHGQEEAISEEGHWDVRLNDDVVGRHVNCDA